MAAEQNRCAETQRLLGSTSLKLAFSRQALNILLAMFPLAYSGQLFHSNSESILLPIFTMLLTL
jgi:hypothetical protein